MLHSALQKYLDDIESIVRTLTNVHIEKYVEEILSFERLNVRMRLRFSNGCLLEINEAVVVANEKVETPGYRHHFQDAKQALIFRYDNAPHFPNLPTFPNHKHLPGKTVAAAKPTIPETIAEAYTAAEAMAKS